MRDKGQDLIVSWLKAATFNFGTLINTTWNVWHETPKILSNMKLKKTNYILKLNIKQ